MTQVTDTNSLKTIHRTVWEMEIPEKFGAMINTLDTMFPKLQDRRMFPRRRYVARMIVSGADGNVIELWTRDISAWNVGFVSDVKLETATCVALRLDLPDGGRYEAHGRIMRCREYEPGCFEGFINFTERNVPEDVLELIARQ